MTASMAVSVVICSYSGDRWESLVSAVEGTRPQLGPDDELVVSVDHNADLSRRARGRWPDVRVVESDEPPGLSGARNSGVRASRGAVVAFLDDDAVPAPDWLRRLRDRYADPSVLGVGGAVEPVWDARPEWFPEEFGWVVGCTYQGLPERAAPVRNLIGANMSFRRDVFSEVGLFRNGIGRVGSAPDGCEETEICIRASRRWPDKVIVFDPAARVLHRVPKSRSTWGYFAARCYREGLSKAHLSRLVGARAGLASERAYASRTLPRAFARAVVDACLRRDRTGFARAGAVAVGLVAATAGYLVGRLPGIRGDAGQGDLRRTVAGA